MSMRYGVALSSVLWMVVVVAVIGVAYLARESSIIPSVTPDGLVADQTTLDLGQRKPSSSTDAAFRLSNPTSGVIAIDGIQLPCDCMTSTFDAPTSLRPGESVRIPIHLEFPQQTGPIARDVIIHTHNRKQRTLNLSIKADIVPPDMLASGER